MLQILFAPRYYDHPAAPDGLGNDTPEFARALRTWREIYPASAPNPQVDYEDWTENAFLLEATLRAASTHRHPLFAVGRHVRTPKDIRSIGHDGIFDPLARTVVIGTMADQNPLTLAPGLVLPAAGPTERPNAYWENRSVLAAMRRPCRLADFTSSEDGDPWTAATSYKRQIVDLYEQLGIRRFFYKLTIPKKLATAGAPIPDGLSGAPLRRAIQDDLFEALDYTPVHYEGQSRIILIQAHRQLTYEYRFLVLGSQPIAGAGMLTEATPAIGNGSTFDNRMRRYPDPSLPIEIESERLARYLDFVTLHAPQVAKTDPEMADCIFDVATDEDAAPSLVELNGLRRFGTYAMSPDLLVEGFIVRALDLSPSSDTGFVWTEPDHLPRSSNLVVADEPTPPAVLDFQQLLSAAGTAPPVPEQAD